jgi:hypothetical protein
MSKQLFEVLIANEQKKEQREQLLFLRSIPCFSTLTRKQTNALLYSTVKRKYIRNSVVY